jgi:hypothetical protein
MGAAHTAAYSWIEGGRRIFGSRHRSVTTPPTGRQKCGVVCLLVQAGNAARPSRTVHDSIVGDLLSTARERAGVDRDAADACSDVGCCPHRTCAGTLPFFLCTEFYTRAAGGA